MTVIEMVRHALIVSGHDGLVHPEGTCGCERDDLAPCMGIGHECRAAFRGIAPWGDDYTFRMFERVEDRDAYVRGEVPEDDFADCPEFRSDVAALDDSA